MVIAFRNKKKVLWCGNGGSAAEGRRTGVPTPLHDCMVALVKGLERSWPA